MTIGHLFVNYTVGLIATEYLSWKYFTENQ